MKNNLKLFLAFFSFPGLFVSVRALMLASVWALGVTALKAQIANQPINATQQVVLQGLRSSAGHGSFSAAQYAPDGSLILLLDEQDGVRILKTGPSATTVIAQAMMGAAGDSGVAIAIDPGGNIYVTGTTTSGSLRATAGVLFPSVADSSTNSFLAKYDANLNLIFLTFLGAGHTAAASVAATADAVFVTGATLSAALPVSAAGIQQVPATGSSENGFVERFNASGSALVYATYLTGANGNTVSTAIVADSADNAFIAGSTSASGYPTIAALQPTILTAGGSTNSGFLSKLNASGSAFVFSTFIAGQGITSMALDSTASSLLLSGNVSLGQFPVATVAVPLTSASYQSLLRIPVDGQSVTSSVLLVPGTQSFVRAAPSGDAWISGTLTTPLFPGDAAPDYTAGDSFLLHLTAADRFDQTLRFGGIALNNASYASLTSNVAAPAISATGTVALPGQMTATVNSALLATQRFDLPLVQSPNAVLPDTLSNILPTAACSQCIGTGALLATIATAVSAPSLSLSSGDLPNLTLRNLGSATAIGLSLGASGFTVATDCGTTLEPSNQCRLALSGTGPGSVTVVAANAAPAIVTVQANTQPPDAIVLSTSELDFGIVTSVDVPATRTVTVANLSSSSQTFTSATDGGPASAPNNFSEAASDCASGGARGVHTLAANSACHITLGLTVSSSRANDDAVRAAWKIGPRDIVLTGFAQAAALNVSSAEVDFGAQFPGTSALRLPRYLYLSNNSDAVVAHILATLPDDSPFTVSDACPSLLAPHSVCRLTLNYLSPIAPSDDSETLTLDARASVLLTGQTLSPATVSGSSADPSLSVSSASLSFATPVAVTGISSAMQPLTVRNTGGVPFAVSVALSGDFALTNGCPAMLSGGASCRLLIGFAPSQPGTRDGLLSLTAGSGFAPALVALSGTGAAVLPANNGTLALGQTLIGEPSVAWYKVQQPLATLTATTGSAQFGVALVAETGGGHGTLPASSFSQTVTGSCSDCWLGAQVLSQTAGPQSTSLTLSSIPGGNPYPLRLTATALPVQGLLLTPIQQDFGPVAIHSSSAALTLTLANLLTPAANVTVQSVSASGDFSIAANTTGGASCSGGVASTASCFMQVVFSPSASGDRSGTLTIVTSGGTATAALTGFGSADPGLAINPVALNFVNVQGSSSSQQSITLSNTGATSLTIGTTAASDPSFSVNSNCATLAPGAICTLAVSFAPQSATVAATLSIPVTLTVNGQTTSTTYTVPLSGGYTAEDAGLEIVPGEVNFGSTATGALGGTRQFTVDNLTTKTVNMTLSLPRQFPLASPSPCAVLAAGGSCSFSVTFLPVTDGPLTGTVFAQGTASDGSTVQALAYMLGYGAGAGKLTINGGDIPYQPIGFGQVGSGQSAQQTLTLTNSGAATLTLRRITSEPPFLSISNCGAALAPGASCSAVLTYAPIDQVAPAASSSPRIDTGTLLVESDAASSPDMVDLTGSVLPVASSSPANSAALAAFQLSNSALTFANTKIEAASVAQTVTLTNTGAATLHILSTVVSTGFSATTNCTTLLPGATCSFAVQFTPAPTSSSTLRSGTLAIWSDSTTSLDFVSLLGTTSASPLTLDPAALDFGAVNVGATGTLPVSLTNTSTTPAALLGLSASGDYTVAQGTCPAVGSVLAAGSSCALSVTFTPSAAGTRTGILSLSTDAFQLPLTVSLTGTGVAAQLLVTPGSFTLTVNGASSATATVPSGYPATFSLALTPLNGFSGPVALTCTPITAGQYASCSLLAASLTLGSNPQSSTATINTITSSAVPAAVLGLMLAPLAWIRRRRSRGGRSRGKHTVPMALLCVLLASIGCISQSGCGGGTATATASNLRKTPAGTYQYQVTASSTSGVAVSSSVTLNLVVQ